MSSFSEVTYKIINKTYIARLLIEQDAEVQLQRLWRYINHHLLNTYSLSYLLT